MIDVASYHFAVWKINLRYHNQTNFCANPNTMSRLSNINKACNVPLLLLRVMQLKPWKKIYRVILIQQDSTSGQTIIKRFTSKSDQNKRKSISIYTQIHASAFCMYIVKAALSRDASIYEILRQTIRKGEKDAEEL